MLNPLNMAKGLGESVKTGAYDYPKEAADTLAQVVGNSIAGQPIGETPMGKRAADIEASEPVQHPVDYAYKNPLDAAGMIAAPVSAFMPEAAIPKAAPVEEEAAAGATKAGTELPIIPPGSKTGDPHALFAFNDKFGPEGAERSVYNVFGDPEHPAIKSTGWGSSVAKDKLDEAGIPITGRQPGSEKYTPIGEAPPKPPPKAAPVTPPTDPVQEVKNYIGGKYNKFASKPGMVPQIADYLQAKSQKMALQQLGASPMQARNLGKTAQAAEDTERAIGQYAMDKDIVGPTVTHSEMLKRHTELQNAAGETLGAIRKATPAPETHNLDVMQAVKAKLDPVYLKGGTSGTGKKAYLLALKDIEKSEPTVQGIADTATELNKNANKAAKINQPHTPYTDVANEASRFNNDYLKQTVGPEKAVKYDAALKEFGVNKVIEQFLKRKVGGEVKRIGAGSFTSNMIQKGMDEFGYRAGSKALNKTSSWVLKNPDAAKNLPSLFKEFIHQIDLPDEPMQGMAHGGLVHDFVEQKYGKK